ncbi:calsequestrin-1-like isoform X7 [Branchiostoma floridae]|uniref:Calsequestrin n=1 Tax=Branchiostoma floridae TaxID=7739 RepID=A0A9J7LAE7_BRAFL|nr:calsequestrin-1-like isoform X7 [Branchiostoma floridae]XP_035679183.1 calsequestrin-1-like isoform X7 [Branchiostoma floridae]
MRLVLWTVCLLLVSGWGALADEPDNPEDEFMFPSWDGDNRILNIGSKNFKKAVKDSEVLIVLFSADFDEHSEGDTQEEVSEYALQVTCQVLEDRDVECGEIDLESDAKLAKQEGVDEHGTILVYKDDEVIEYLGHRAPEILISFVVDLFEDAHVDIIKGKSGKEDFDDDDDEVRVVGWFEDKNSKHYKEFEDAANHFPTLEFFATFDPKLAKQLKLKDLNDILIYRPFEKEPVEIEDDDPHGLEEHEIEEFIEANMEPIIEKFTLEDLHRVWDEDEDDHMIVFFAEEDDKEGKQFLKLVAQLARKNADENLDFIWIDPDEVPTLEDYFEEVFDIDLDEPQIGVVDLDDNDSVFLDLPDDGLPTLDELQAWVDDILDGDIDYDDDDDDDDDGQHLQAGMTTTMTTTTTMMKTKTMTTRVSSENLVPREKRPLSRDGSSSP